MIQKSTKEKGDVFFPMNIKSFLQSFRFHSIFFLEMFCIDYKAQFRTLVLFGEQYRMVLMLSIGSAHIDKCKK